MANENTAANLTFESHCKKRVSFVLTTKNRAQYLMSALERCRGLKGPHDELIVIDGQSSDNTKEIVEQYRDIVDIFVSESDISYAHAHNKGFLLASGKYIKELMDDDIFHPEGVEKAIRVLEEHPEIDLLLCGGTKEQDGVIRSWYAPPGSNFGHSVEDVFMYPGAAGVLHFIRRSSLAKVGILSETRPMCDMAFVLEFISKGCTVKFCRINTIKNVRHSETASFKNQYKSELDKIRLAKKYCSPLFYIKWRLFQKNGFIKRSKRKIRERTRLMIGGIIGEKYLLRLNPLKTQKKEKPLNVSWADGGFS